MVPQTLFHARFSEARLPEVAPLDIVRPPRSTDDNGELNPNNDQGRQAPPLHALVVETQRSRRPTKKPQRKSPWFIAGTMKRMRVPGHRELESILRCLVEPSWIFVIFVFQIDGRLSLLCHHSLVPKITTTSEFTVTEKRSRFLALAAPASSLDEAKKVVRKRSRKLHKARHHCWACRVRDENDRVVEQARDDGEVGRPGHILLDQLRRADLEGIIVVSRFFGGVKLGPAGVGRAFRAAGEGALNGIT